MGTGFRSGRAVRVGSLLFAGALIASVLVAAVPASASSVVQTIPVGHEPFAVSSDGTHVWVTNVADNTVSELSASTGVVVRTIGVGDEPRGISSDGTDVWVTNNNDNTVTELKASTGAVVRTIGVGSGPFGVSSDGTHVWVENGADSTVSELSASTGAVIRTIGVAISPVAVSSDGTHVWVTSEGFSGGIVTELSASTGAVIRTIFCCDSFPIGVSSDGTDVWVANTNFNTVSELSASTGVVVRTIGVGNSPSGISSDGTDVWVTNNSDNTVTELKASTGAVTQTIGVGNNPIGVSSDGTHVWVTHAISNTVTEIASSGPLGNIFATTFKNCTTLHVGYNRFVNGTIVHWRVTTNSVGTVASGQFSAIGGGNLGAKTYHFLDIALGTTLPSDASGIQSHVLFTWANGGRFYATRDPGCRATLADLSGSYVGGTGSAVQNGGTCPPVGFAFYLKFDTAYTGSAAVGTVALHLEGCADFSNDNFTAGTFRLSTNVGSVTGTADGSATATLDQNFNPVVDLSLTFTVTSGTGAFSTTTGTLRFTQHQPEFEPVTGTIAA